MQKDVFEIGAVHASLDSVQKYQQYEVFII